MSPQPRHWRGMGHSRVEYAGDGGEGDSEDEKERSDVASSGNTTVAYTVEPDGEVKPIAGEEEEEEEEEAGEEEGGGGEEFPPLPTKLEETFTVHKTSLFTNDPDLTLTEWEVEVDIPEDATYLAVPYLQDDRQGSPNLPGTVDMKLNGAAATKSNKTIFTTTAGNTTRHYRGFFIWENPPTGKQILKITLLGWEGEGKGQSYIVALPISVTSGINARKTAIAAEPFSIKTGARETAKFWKDNYTPELPSAYMHCVAQSGFPADTPQFSNIWTGYKIFGVKITSPIGNLPKVSFEVFVGVKPTGATTSEAFYGPGCECNASSWLAGTRALMNL